MPEDKTLWYLGGICQQACATGNTPDRGEVLTLRVPLLQYSSNSQTSLA